MSSEARKDWTIIRKAIYACLSDGIHENDIKTACLVAIDLARYVQDDLSEYQRVALEFSTEFWSRQRVDQDNLRLHHLEVLGRQLDKDMAEGVGASRTASLNRLVWASLLTTAGMSEAWGEFIVDLAEEAGISATQMFDVLARNVPGFPSVTKASQDTGE